MQIKSEKTRSLVARFKSLQISVHVQCAGLLRTQEREKMSVTPLKQLY
jgi:hypothetical protein